MLHCFGCGRDLPDNLAYCLYCGAKLEDEEETVVNPKPAPQPMPPESRQSSGVGRFLLGSLLGGLLVLLFLIAGAFIFFSMRDGRETAMNSTPNNTNIPSAPSPTPPARSPTPKKPSPSPTVSKVNDNAVPTNDHRQCIIINPEGASVNLRRDCDTRDCSEDASTIYTQGEPGDDLRTTGRSPVTTGRFTWVQVRYHGESLWISSNRLSCE